MHSLFQLTESLNEYLQTLLAPKPLEIFTLYYVPIIQLFIVFLGAIAGVYKYYRTKNIETYEKILNEVYAPFYQYIIKQELFRKIHNMGEDYKTSPILEIRNRKTKSDGNGVITESTAVCNLDRSELLKIIESVNIGLASQELLTLFSMYEMTIHMEKNYNITSTEFIKATILKVKIENALRYEIISGYNKYHDLLGLKDNSKSGLWELTSDNVIYKYNISDKEIEDLRAEIESNPSKYKQQ